jgi:hypothetical protein
VLEEQLVEGVEDPEVWLKCERGENLHEGDLLVGPQWEGAKEVHLEPEAPCMAVLVRGAVEEVRVYEESGNDVVARVIGAG